MRIIFAGTPMAAVPTLEALIQSRHDVVSIVTRPPARKGRGRTSHPSEVAEVGGQHGIPLIEVTSFKDEHACNAVNAVQADLGVVVAYGALIPPKVLEIPRHGWINLHFSDLPRWRGAAPVQWSILAGDRQTASCVFQLEAGLDTGPIYSRLEVPIGHSTSGELLEQMAQIGGSQVVDVVDTIDDGNAHYEPQNTGVDNEFVTSAPRLTPRDAFVDFTQSSFEVDRQIRAMIPNPGAWTTLPQGRRIKLDTVTPTDNLTPGQGYLLISKNQIEVGCRTGTVILGKVAPAGKGWMDATAWSRGAHLDNGQRLGLNAPVQESNGKISQ